MSRKSIFIYGLTYSRNFTCTNIYKYIYIYVCVYMYVDSYVSINLITLYGKKEFKRIHTKNIYMILKSHLLRKVIFKLYNQFFLEINI